MDAKEEKMLIDLTSAKGIAGNEDEVRSLFKKYAAPYADKFLYDGLGSIIAKNVGDKEGPKVYISGHMDEVGFMVTQITEKGFLKFQTVGGWWGQVMLAQQVQIKTTTGKVYHGVQEEVGLRGAQTSTHLVNPDIAFALDTGTAGDTPGMTPKEADSVLGEGPQILIYDASMIPHKKLRDFVIQVAEENNIPFQYTVITGGGTDAGRMHLTRNGIPSLAITVPVRYLHSHTSVIHEDDYFNTVKLVTEVVKRLDKETVAKLTSY